MSDKPVVKDPELAYVLARIQEMQGILAVLIEKVALWRGEARKP